MFSVCASRFGEMLIQFVISLLACSRFFGTKQQFFKKGLNFNNIKGANVNEYSKHDFNIAKILGIV
jgi:hypothetical protein